MKRRRRLAAVAAVFLFAAVAGFAAGAAALPEEEALPGRVAGRAAESIGNAAFAAVKGVENAAEKMENAAVLPEEEVLPGRVAGRAAESIGNAAFAAAKGVENAAESAEKAAFAAVKGVENAAEKMENAAVLPEEEALPGRVAGRAAEKKENEAFAAVEEAENAAFAAVKGVEKAAESVESAALFVADGTENAVFSAAKEVENESFSAAEDAETPAADVLRAALLDAMACGRLFDSKNGAVSVLFERTSGVDEAETLCAAAYAVFWDAALSHPEDFAHTVPVIAAWEVPEGLRLTLTVGSDGELPLETLAAMRFCAYERAAAVARELKRDAAFREGSPSEKARMTALRLAAAAVYDEEGCAVSDTAYGALVLGRATCEGFAGAFDLVCGLLGLEAQAAYDDEHMWNRVTADGDALTVDVTALAAGFAAASENEKVGAAG